MQQQQPQQTQPQVPVVVSQTGLLGQQGVVVATPTVPQQPPPPPQAYYNPYAIQPVVPLPAPKRERKPLLMADSNTKQAINATSSITNPFESQVKFVNFY
jgi:hypothetical protein